MWCHFLRAPFWGLSAQRGQVQILEGQNAVWQLHHWKTNGAFSLKELHTFSGLHAISSPLLPVSTYTEPTVRQWQSSPSNTGRGFSSSWTWGLPARDLWICWTRRPSQKGSCQTWPGPGPHQGPGWTAWYSHSRREHPVFRLLSKGHGSGEGGNVQPALAPALAFSGTARAEPRQESWVGFRNLDTILVASHVAPTSPFVIWGYHVRDVRNTKTRHLFIPLETDIPRFNFWLSHLLVEWPWLGDLVSELQFHCL